MEQLPIEEVNEVKEVKEVKIVYSSYTEAQARASKKWVNKNKEKVREYQLKYSHTYYEENKEKIRKRNLERYYEKKERLAKVKEIEHA